MGVFHVFKIVQMVPNRAKHHISRIVVCKLLGGKELLTVTKINTYVAFLNGNHKLIIFLKTVNIYL